jgi:hypothetical protein
VYKRQVLHTIEKTIVSGHTTLAGMMLDSFLTRSSSLIKS